MRRLAVILAVMTCALCSAQDQQPETVLVGITNIKEHEQHLYSVALPIIEKVAGADSNLVCRIFISKITHSDCCDPVWLGGDCFRCCDNPNHIVCTNNGFVKGIIESIKDIPEEEWKEAQISNFNEVKEWVSMLPLLDAIQSVRSRPRAQLPTNFGEK